MEQYIPKAAVMAEIERTQKILNLDDCGGRSVMAWSEDFKNFLDTLEVKESKLPNPRFPHLNNIVDKVFGTGNLESFEYEEAEQLVLLAKEELLKDLEVKGVDLEKEIENYFKGFGKFPSVGIDDCIDIARHFYELGLKAAQKGE